MKMLTYSNNDQMPAFGLGTWKSNLGEVKKAVIHAIESGYRHIDCAAIYGNENEVGEGIKHSLDRGIVKREDLWITSKLWNNAHKKDDTGPALEKTLKDLKLGYLDLYLMHWPVAFKRSVSFPENEDSFLSLDEAPLTETWKAMEDLKEKGLTKHIGVSNFSRQKLQLLIDQSDQKPENNQIELHPYLQQQALVDFCHENDIHVTAYSPLGSMDRPDNMKRKGEPVPLENEVIKSLAKGYDASPAQILIAWALQRNMSVIPKSTNSKRIEENFAAQKIALTEQEMKLIKSLDHGERIIDGSFFNAASKGYSIASLWDE